MSTASFDYVRASALDDAIAKGAANGCIYLAGGTDLLQLCKAGLAGPHRVIDISHLPLAEVAHDGDVLTIGALARLSDVAGHPHVATHTPLIRAAVLASASGQIRNMATVGGNLLQRTRCPYFRDAGLACNKHEAGSGCSARHGENRHAVIFGGSAGCVAAHASDLAVALAALDAEIVVAGAGGERRLGLAELYPLPDATHAPDSSLAAGDVITAVRVHDARRFAQRSTYLKIRDRASFEFAVVSVAAALCIQEGLVVAARLAAGGVAPLPWRLRESEAALVGRPPTPETFAAATDLAVEGAAPLTRNGFKVQLLHGAVARALQTVGGRA